ncbi:hypothetical protein BJ742DRAFT_881992 [Cladochytrium replicatum]|nr:hypothetical protein BJ742DRAFT_881992 [Cladochytrium replicatum]
MTRQCVRTAATIIESMDERFDPCDDFYTFACGRWIESHPIPESKANTGILSQIADQNREIFRRVFEGPYIEDKEIEDAAEAAKDKYLFEKAKTLYTTCLNETQIENDGLESFKELASDVMNSSLPIAPTGTLEVARFSALMKALSSIDIHLFTSLEVSSDLRNPDTYLLYVDQGGLSLPSKDFYEDSSTQPEELRAVINEVLGLLYESDLPLFRGRDPKKDAMDIVTLEKQIAHISASATDMHNVSKAFNPITIDELQDLSPAIPWTTYLTALLSPHIPITGSTPLSVSNKSFFSELSSIIAKTDPKTIEVYALWNLADQFGRSTFKRMRDVLKKLDVIFGRAAAVEPPRWESCIKVVDLVMGLGVSKWFVNRAFEDGGVGVKKRAEEVVDRVLQAMMSRLPHLTWLDEATRSGAAEKISTIRKKIAFPNEIFNATAMHEKYSLLSFSPTSHLLNKVEGSRFGVSKSLNDLANGKVDHSRWLMSPATVNAYYNPPENEIVFLAGVLRPPLFIGVEGVPLALNYGALGMIVGHELTHAFDNNGRLFDKSGRMRDWWTETTGEQFNAKTECFIKEYDKFTVDGISDEPLHINGRLTLSENLADNGGISRAFEAWKEQQQELSQNTKPNGAKPDSRLPGLGDYTSEQLFFIAFGQAWCNSMRPAAQLASIRTDPHAPSQVRVNGALRNSKPFVDAFGCKAGSHMNPAKKCEIW